MNNLMGLESLPRDIVSCFVLRNTRSATLKNVALYSIISKTFDETINSKEFFRTFAYWAGASEFLSEEILNLSCFKARYFALRRIIIPKVITEVLPGATLGDAWVNEEGVTLFSLNPKLGYLLLKEGSLFNPFDFPEDMPLDLGNALNAPPSIAKSKDYLAVHGSDGRVHIYRTDGNCLSTYDVTGDIKQMYIRDDRLYVVCKKISSFYLSVYDLEQSKELVLTVLAHYDPSTRICFGKEYLIYSSKFLVGNGKIAISLSDLTMEIHDPTPKIDQSYSFPMGDEFVEVNFSTEFQCDIRKISLKDGMIHQSIIKENLVLGLKGGRKDVCLHEDRLLVAYRRAGKGMTLVSYDLILDQLTELPLIPSTQVASLGELFKPRILCLAEKVYYLFMVLEGENGNKSNLTTFTFSKI